MNLDDMGTGSIGGLIGGGLVLLKDILWGTNKRLAKIEIKLDEVVSHTTCEAIRADTKIHISDMKDDMRYIRARLDEVMSSVQRHREDYKS